MYAEGFFCAWSDFWHETCIYIVVAVEADAENEKGGPTYSARLSAVVQRSLPVASRQIVDRLLGLYIKE